MKKLSAFALTLLILALGALPAFALKRVALVVGNNAYEHVAPLEKAVNDADAMTRALEGRGFSVIRAVNLSRRDMNRAMQKFVSRIEPGDVAMLFYAGHGVEIRGENFLLPVDIPNAGPGQEDFVKGEAISLSDVLERLKRRKAQLNIVILDACRDNPFQTASSRGVGGTRGLARVSWGQRASTPAMNCSVKACDRTRTSRISAMSQMSSAVSRARNCRTGGVPTRMRSMPSPGR